MAALVAFDLVQQFFPVGWNASVRSRHRLARWVRVRCNEFRTLDKVFRSEIVKPVLARFEACDYRVLRLFGMLSRMLARRAIATTNVSALRTPAKMQPPAIG
jgi:hypothetical protein